MELLRSPTFRFVSFCSVSCSVLRSVLFCSVLRFVLCCSRCVVLFYVLVLFCVVLVVLSCSMFSFCSVLFFSISCVLLFLPYSLFFFGGRFLYSALFRSVLCSVCFPIYPPGGIVAISYVPFCLVLFCVLFCPAFCSVIRSRFMCCSVLCCIFSIYTSNSNDSNDSSVSICSIYSKKSEQFEGFHQFALLFPITKKISPIYSSNSKY